MKSFSFRFSKIAICISPFSLFSHQALSEIDHNKISVLIESQSNKWFQQLEQSLPVYPKVGSVAAGMDQQGSLFRQQADLARKTLAEEDANQDYSHVAMLMRMAALQDFATKIDDNVYYEWSSDLRTLIKRAIYAFDPNKGKLRTYDFILKDKYRRGRPYQVLDEQGNYKADYQTIKGSSYPSGHSSNGFGEAVLASIIFPERGEEIFSRALQYAESRTVLGAHFPTDTIASRFSRYYYQAQLLNDDVLATNLVQFAQNIREPFDSICREQGSGELNRCLSSLPSPLADQYVLDNHKIGYYNQIFPNYPIQTVLPENLPQTAGALLRLRFPYLTDNARRQILAATAYPSNSLARLGDFSQPEQNWGLINLPLSYRGPSYFYSDFETLGEPEQHLDLGRFSLNDTWTQDIHGSGRLIMNHNGNLNLTGSNDFAGIVVNQGSVRLAGHHQLKGTSDVNTSGYLMIAEDKPFLEYLRGSGTVIFEPSHQFSTLTLNQLSGNLNFLLNTDLAQQQSDKIVVKGSDSGDFNLLIADSGNEPNAENGKVTLVETQTGTAQFHLFKREFVDAGAFRYRLKKEGTHWVLSNQNGERTVMPQQEENITPLENNQGNNLISAEPVISQITQSQPTELISPQVNNQENNVTPVEPTILPMVDTLQNSREQVPLVSIQPAQIVLSERSNALVSLRQAQLLQLEQELVGIHQRLGELKQNENNVWVRNVTGRYKYASQSVSHNSVSSGFTQDYHNVQLGADMAFSNIFHFGAFMGKGRADIDFHGQYGSGKIRSKSVGLYGTVQFDNNVYWENVAKYSRLNSTSATTGKHRYHAYTLSTELGKQFELNHWRITPHVLLAWENISNNADEKRLSAVYTRLGTRLSKFITQGEWTIQPYAEINGIMVKNNSADVKVNQYIFDVKSSHNRLETAIGVNIEKVNHRFGIEGKMAKGKHLAQPFVLQASYHYSW